MKRTFIILSFLLFIQFSFSQNTISIKGKVVDQSITPLPAVSIVVDGKEITTTDFDGKFEIEINKEVKTIIFRFTGTENLTVLLKENCNNLEVIFLEESGCYLGYSLRKVNRIRKKRFNRREKYHKMAYDKGLFSSETSCAEPQFKAY